MSQRSPTPQRPSIEIGSPRRLTASDGAELAYWISQPDGGGECAVLLLHGAASNHTRWSEFVDKTTLRETWPLVWPDLRGNGDSTLRTKQGVAIWCRDLLEILDAEGFAETVVVGHSLGAQIGMHLVQLAPQRVRAIVLIDPVFRRALRGKHGFYSRFPGALQGAAGVVSAFNRLGVRRRRIPNRDLRELDEETRQAMSGGEAFEVIAERYGALGPVMRHMPLANYLGQMAAMSRDVPPLEKIACPVLVLLSANITFADMKVNRQELDRFPNCEIVTLSANHWPLTEAPDETRRAIEDWVGTLDVPLRG